jgi:hypothetical protein
MKKLLVVLFCLASISLFAQTPQTPVAGSKTLNNGAYVSYLGGAGDTLVASDNIDVVLRITDPKQCDLVFGLKVTKISGTVTNTFVFYKSMDGATWATTGDTITFTNTSSTVSLKEIADYKYPYIKLVGTAGATAQKAKYQLYAIRKND